MEESSTKEEVAVFQMTIKEELEKLNNASSEINSAAVSLKELKTTFLLLLRDSSHRLGFIEETCSKSVSSARPYFEAHQAVEELFEEKHLVAEELQKAMEWWKTAKQMECQTEDEILNEQEFSEELQHRLNEANFKVHVAFAQKLKQEAKYQDFIYRCCEAEEKLSRLKLRLKKDVNMASPYFETLELSNRALDRLQTKIEDTVEEGTRAKAVYETSFRKLQLISEFIHKQRSLVQNYQEPDSIGKFDDSIPTSASTENLTFIQARRPKLAVASAKWKSI